MHVDYLDNSLLLKEDYERYAETRESISEGLSDQVEPDQVSAEDLLEDENLSIPEEVFEGDTRVDPVHRYLIEDLGESRVVYTFDHSLGFEIVGDYSMVRQAAPDYVPDAVIPIPEVESDQPEI